MMRQHRGERGRRKPKNIAEKLKLHRFSVKNSIKYKSERREICVKDRYTTED